RSALLNDGTVTYGNKLSQRESVARPLARARSCGRGATPCQGPAPVACLPTPRGLATQRPVPSALTFTDPLRSRSARCNAVVRCSCAAVLDGALDCATRSEERRVGKECRSRWEPER